MRPVRGCGLLVSSNFTGCTTLGGWVRAPPKFLPDTYVLKVYLKIMSK